MPTARPFAYNPGAPISGTTQYGTLAVGVSPELNYPSGAGGIRWWNGPDEELGWCIGTSVPSGDQPTPDGDIGTVGFWRTENFDDNEFIELASIVTGQNFTGGTQAKTYLNNNGYWTSYDENPPSLLLYLDSGNSSSYSGTGSIWYDLTTYNNNATLINSPTYSSNNGGILQFDDASLEYGTAPNLGNLSQWTVEVWFRLTSPLTGKVTSILSNEFDLLNKLNFSIGTNNQPTNANLAVGFYDGSWHSTTGFVPQTNVWYQVVGTYDGSVVRQYVNGTASGGTLNYVGTPQSGGVNRIMRRWDSALTAGNLVDGDLAIVKIYNTPLNSGEILNNYNSTYTRFIEPTSTPTATPTLTPTITPSLSETSTPTPTLTPSITPSTSPSPSPTITPTRTQTPTPSITPTTSVTPTPSITPTTSITPTLTRTQTPTPTRPAYLYYRWQITETKVTPPDANATQAAEFVFQINGVDQSMAGVTVTNPGGSNPSGETPSNLVDNNLTTKVVDINFVTNGLSNFIFQFSSAKSFNGYRWATANDFDSRDPKSWTIAGSNNGTTWTTLSTVSNFTATVARDTYQTPQTY